MTINEMIKKYNITMMVQNGQEMISARPYKKPTQAEVEAIKAAKPEILAEIKRQKAEEKAAYEARQAKINAIEGLDIIRKAIDAEENFRASFNRAMENGSCLFPSQPKESSAELKKEYPRAAAYLKAEAYEHASNYAKSAAGKKAKERIINGEDYTKVLADMEAEWTKAAQESIWN